MIIGFDNHMFPGASIALGRNAHSETEQVAICDGGDQLVVTKNGAFYGDRSVAGESVVVALQKIAGDVPNTFELRSPGGCLDVDANGVVYVNGQVVGQDPLMMARILSFLVRTLCPQADSWIPRVIGERRNPCCGNTSTHGEGDVEYCGACGREVRRG